MDLIRYFESKFVGRFFALVDVLCRSLFPTLRRILEKHSRGSVWEWRFDQIDGLVLCERVLWRVAFPSNCSCVGGRSVRWQNGLAFDVLLIIRSLIGRPH